MPSSLHQAAEAKPDAVGAVAGTVSRPEAPVTGTDEERQWVQQIRAGDVAAFERLFHTYYKPLTNLALRYLHARDAAEEVTQTVFVQLWQTRSTWTIQSTLRGYLYTLVRNTALNEVRHRQVVARTEAEALQDDRIFTPGVSESASAATDDHVLRDEVAAAIRRAVSALPPRVRLAYTLQRDHGLTYAEVAETMAVSGKTVEKLLTRAHMALRKALAAYR